MAITLAQDTLKINIDRKVGLGLMIYASLIICAVIIANMVWLFTYDVNEISKAMQGSSQKIPSPAEIDAYVRFRMIMSIVGNTLIFATFSALVWWGMGKKRFGALFGVFWLFIFGTNAIAYPFYVGHGGALTIIIAILNGFLSIYLVYWLATLLQYRSRLRQEKARGRR